MRLYSDLAVRIPASAATPASTTAAGAAATTADAASLSSVLAEVGALGLGRVALDTVVDLRFASDALERLAPPVVASKTAQPAASTIPASGSSRRGNARDGKSSGSVDAALDGRAQLQRNRRSGSGSPVVLSRVTVVLPDDLPIPSSRGATAGGDEVRSIPAEQQKHNQYQKQKSVRNRLSAAMQALHGTGSHAVLSKFDLVAVQPSTATQFVAACSTLDVDIVTLDFAQRLSYTLRPGVVKQALDRGVFLEIRFGDAFEHNRNGGQCSGDGSGKGTGGVSASATHLMSQAMNLVRTSKGRGLLLSSGAVSALALRSPADTVNLGVLFGMSNDAAMHAVSTAAEAAIAHSIARRHGKGVMRASVVSTDAADWRVPPSASDLVGSSVLLQRTDPNVPSAMLPTQPTIPTDKRKREQVE